LRQSSGLALSLKRSAERWLAARTENTPARIKQFEDGASKVLAVWNRTYDWSQRESVFGAAHGYKRAQDSE